MLHGDVITNGWRDDNVKEALDLCLSCKGCKGDCPVNVDMATYKAEFLSHYWEGRVRPRQAYAFGLIDRWARLASLWPGLVNLITQTPGLSHLAKVLAGMPLQRRIPEFAPETFRAWFQKRKPNPRQSGRVILWADTFNNYFFPETAQAATEVLEGAGFNVAIPAAHLCCGRPLYDYGFLDLAKQYLRRIMTEMREDIQAGVPVVVLEPSCASVFRDELHNLFPDDPLAKKLTEQTFLLSEFLKEKADGWQAPQSHRKAIVQGHCHHKSLLRFDDEKCVLEKLGLDFKLLPSGCCGMAGSFGFESDKYKVSLDIGERVVLPEVRKADADTLVVADGFSCREQIAHGTKRQALHLAEVIQMAKSNGSAGIPHGYAESDLVERRKKKLRRARVRALIGIGSIVASAVLARKLIREYL
jgi:Fe-S oxidoreductase